MKKYKKPTIICLETHTEQLMVSSLPIDGETNTDIAYQKDFYEFEDEMLNNGGFELWKKK